MSSMDSHNTKHHCFNLISILILFIAPFHLCYAVVAQAPVPGGDEALFLSYKHVVIRNNMEQKQTLEVHCRSKDNDLGTVKLAFGESWGFSFHVNVWGTTRYYCNFMWPGQSKWFDIFLASRDDKIGGPWPRCRECIWSITGDTFGGPCRINTNGKVPLCFGWNAGP